MKDFNGYMFLTIEIRGGVIMGLTPQQALLQLERYEYYEVYYNDKRYGF